MLVEHTKEEMVAYKAAWKRENAVPMKKGDRTSKGTACTSSTACESDDTVAMQLSLIRFR